MDFSVDFSPLANLPKVYREEQSRRSLADLGKSLANGDIDYRQAAGLAAEANRPDLSLSLLQLGEKKDQERDFAKQMTALLNPGASDTKPAPAAPPPAPTQSVPQYVPLPQPRPQPNSPGVPMASLASLSPENIPAPTRAAVASSPRVWGDQEAQAAGLYEGGPATTGAPPAFNDRFAQVTAPTPAQSPQAAPQGAPPLAKQNPLTSNVPALMMILSHPGAPAGQKKAAEIALQEAIKQPDNIREYQAYYKQTQDAGQQPVSLLDWTIKIKQAGATAITNDMRGETEEAKGIGKSAAERYARTMDAAQAAPKKLQNLARMEALLGQVSQGKIEPARMSISAWAKSFGLDDASAERLGLDPKGVGTAQAVEALSNELTLGHIGPGGLPANNFSNTDRAFVTEIVPQLGNDPQANRLKIEASRRLAQLDVEKAKDLSEWRRNNKGKSVDDFEVEWADKVAKKDLFGDLVREAQTLVKQSANPAQQQALPQGFPPNARRAPDGKYYVPDPNRPGKYLEVR